MGLWSVFYGDRSALYGGQRSVSYDEASIRRRWFVHVVGLCACVAAAKTSVSGSGISPFPSEISASMPDLWKTPSHRNDERRTGQPLSGDEWDSARLENLALVLAAAHPESRELKGGLY